MATSVQVVPVGPSVNEYAETVQKKLLAAGYQAEVDTDPGDTLSKNIRNVQLAQFNFILGKWVLCLPIYLNMKTL